MFSARSLSRCILPALGLCAVLSGCGHSSRDATYVVPERLVVEITGSDFKWRVRYPGADGRLGTDDDVFGRQDVHVPVGTPTELQLRSTDFVYTLAIPHLGLKEVAIPDLEFSLTFVPKRTGKFELRGDQMCGYTHPDLIGTLFVQSPSEYVTTTSRLARE